jgi:ketosteroid isomerase-like protein
VDYGRHVDAGDFAAYGALFARDGEVKLGPMGRAKGPAEIEALMRKAIGDQVGETYHIISSPTVEIDGDEATSNVMWTVVGSDDAGQPTVTMVGRHLDRLVREDGRWRFLERKGRIHIPSAPPG